MNQIIKAVKNKISELEGSIIYIHSDITRGFRILSRKRKELLELHYSAIEHVCEGLDIWMPAFNYDFCKTGEFNSDDDQSQVGILSEFFRKNKADWRYPTPIFSFSGKGEFPKLNEEDIVNPWGPNSLFNYLHENNALVMFYGTNLIHNTIAHYAEDISNQLIYRYYKEFVGEVTHLGKRKEIKIKFHVKDMKGSLEYDTEKIQRDLIERGILHTFKDDFTEIHVARVDEMMDYYLEMINLDPFYLLSERSKLIIGEIYNKLNRPFIISDFE